MSDVTPLDTPNATETPLVTPHMTMTILHYEGSYLPGVTCNTVVIADLGKSPGTSTYSRHLPVGQEWQFWMFTIRAHIPPDHLADLPPISRS